MAKKINITAQLNAATTDGILADAGQIFDAKKGKFQEQVNEEFENALEEAITSEDTDMVVESIEEGFVHNALRKTKQILTEAEKEQARENIGVESKEVYEREAVRVKKQYFTDTEKYQARHNIEAINAAEAAQIAEEKIYETSVSAPNKLEKVQELAAWMESNPDSVATMNEQIAGNSEDVQRLYRGTGIEEYSQFSDGNAYAVGTIVLYDGALFRFKADHAKGEWDYNEVEEWSEKKERESLEWQVGVGLSSVGRREIHADFSAKSTNQQSERVVIFGDTIDVKVTTSGGSWVLVVQFSDGYLLYRTLASTTLDLRELTNLHGSAESIYIYLKGEQIAASADVTLYFGDWLTMINAIQSIEKEKLNKTAESALEGYSLVVGPNGDISPSVKLYEYESTVESSNVYQIGAGKELITQDSTGVFISANYGVTAVVGEHSLIDKYIMAKIMVDDLSVYGVTQVYPVLSDDEPSVGVNFTAKGTISLPNNGGYFHSVNDSAVLSVVVVFNSVANKQSYADYVLSRLMVTIGDKISWPTEYEEFKGSTFKAFPWVDKKQGKTNAGKVLKVNAMGVVVPTEVEGIDSSDFVRKDISQQYTLGSNIISSIVGVGDGWSHSNGVYTHSSGYTEPLTFHIATKSNAKYIAILYTGTNVFFEHSVNVSIGSGELCDIYRGITGPYYIGLIADGGYLKITPSSNYTSTIQGVELREIVEEGGDVEVVLELNNVEAGTMENNISGFWNTAIGTTDTMLSLVNGSRNIGVGHHCMTNMKSGERNIGIGTFALNQMQWGVRNVAIGSDAMYRAKKLTDNIAIGKGACGHTHADPSAHTYERNVAIGTHAIEGESANYYDNTAVGYSAMAASPSKTTNRQRNTALGVEAGYYAQDDNVAIGYRSNRYLRGSKNVTVGALTGHYQEVSGDENILIGYSARVETGGNGHNNCIVIGSQAKGTKSNQVVIGNKFQTELILLGDKKIIFNADGTVTWESI